MDHTYFILSILVCFSRLALAADPPAPSPSVPTTIAPTTVPSTIPAIICTPACEHDGVCIAATDGVNHCDCTSTGYTNDTCDTECGPGACLNNGTCISNVHGPGTSCHCEETFSGPTCSEAPNSTAEASLTPSVSLVSSTTAAPGASPSITPSSSSTSAASHQPSAATSTPTTPHTTPHTTTVDSSPPDAARRTTFVDDSISGDVAPGSTVESIETAHGSALTDDTPPTIDGPLDGAEDHDDDRDDHNGFDGASFIGGIVLCAGIFVMAGFGYKLYQSRRERSYATL